MKMVAATCSVLMGFALFGCTSAQVAQTEAVGNTALVIAQAACAKIPVAQAIAASNLHGGASNTVTQIAGIANATCDVVNLAAAVQKDPATGAFVDGLGAAIVAASTTSPPS